MEHGIWKTPVVLEMYGRPGPVVVKGTLDAALMLIGAWPAKRTETHMTAVTACRDVLVGKADPALARADFIDAALEAGYRIQPETFLSARWDVDEASLPSQSPVLGLVDLIRRHAASPAGDDAAARSASPTRPLTVPASPAPSAPVLAKEQPIGLRELLGRLVQVLGLIGVELGRQAAGLFNFGLTRPGNSQPQ
jgi:hypothetical protein